MLVDDDLVLRNESYMKRVTSIPLNTYKLSMKVPDIDWFILVEYFFFDYVFEASGRYITICQYLPVIDQIEDAVERRRVLCLIRVGDFDYLGIQPFPF